MRKILYVVGVIAVILLLWAGGFAWKNLRGVGPAVRAPAGDIAEIIGKETPRLRSDGTSDLRSENNTGFPLKLPQGFSIGIFAKGLGKPRVIIKDPAGGLLVSIPSQGRIVSLPDENGDGVADRVVTVIDKLNKPHGIVAHCGDGCTLVIAESHRVARYRYETTTRTATFETKLFDLPDDGGHSTRTLLQYEERLLVSVGSSCNVCEEKDARRSTVHITNTEGTAIEPFATGLRNAVFLATHPWTGAVWVTEMGRDLLGDNLPPDEVNIIGSPSTPLGDYGWPYCYGKQVHDDNFDPKKTHACDITAPSMIDLPAHSAPLGLAFVPEPVEGQSWPEEYQHDLLVAFHGSWNRSEPTGYKIVRYPFEREGVVREGARGEIAPKPIDFISGWLQKDGTALGRPVDLLVEPNGVVYISDDKAGVIYKVWKN